jgi:hypothetical protein
MKHVKTRSDRPYHFARICKRTAASQTSIYPNGGNISRPCLRRVRALEESGYIRGYHADVAPDKMGFGLTVFIHVGLANHTEADLMHFASNATIGR